MQIPKRKPRDKIVKEAFKELFEIFKDPTQTSNENKTQIKNFKLDSTPLLQNKNRTEKPSINKKINDSKKKSQQSKETFLYTSLIDENQKI